MVSVDAVGVVMIRVVAARTPHRAWVSMRRRPSASREFMTTMSVLWWVWSGDDEGEP